MKKAPITIMIHGGDDDRQRDEVAEAIMKTMDNLKIENEIRVGLLDDGHTLGMESRETH